MHTGDSGGPLVVKNAAFEVYEVIGLTKGGDGCGARNIPGLYTSIVTYLPWIKKHRDQYGWMLQQRHDEDWVPSSIIKTSFSGENLLTDHLWPDGEVPYRVESTFSSGQLEKIARAMEDISAAVPCVHFRFMAKRYFDKLMRREPFREVDPAFAENHVLIAQNQGYGCFSDLGELNHFKRI